MSWMRWSAPGDELYGGGTSRDELYGGGTSRDELYGGGTSRNALSYDGGAPVGCPAAAGTRCTLAGPALLGGGLFSALRCTDVASAFRPVAAGTADDAGYEAGLRATARDPVTESCAGERCTVGRTAAASERAESAYGTPRGRHAGCRRAGGTRHDRPVREGKARSRAVRDPVNCALGAAVLPAAPLARSDPVGSDDDAVLRCSCAPGPDCAEPVAGTASAGGALPGIDSPARPSTDIARRRGQRRESGPFPCGRCRQERCRAGGRWPRGTLHRRGRDTTLAARRPRCLDRAADVLADQPSGGATDPGEPPAPVDDDVGSPLPGETHRTAGRAGRSVSCGAGRWVRPRPLRRTGPRRSAMRRLARRSTRRLRACRRRIVADRPGCPVSRGVRSGVPRQSHSTRSGRARSARARRTTAGPTTVSGQCAAGSAALRRCRPPRPASPCSRASAVSLL